MGVLRPLAAPHKEQIDREAQPSRQRKTAQDRDAKPVDAGENVDYNATVDEATGMLMRLPPGRHVRMSLRTALPPTAESGSADVWRIVERTAGRITGGVTIIVQANQKKGNQNAATSRRASSV